VKKLVVASLLLLTIALMPTIPMLAQAGSLRVSTVGVVGVGGASPTSSRIFSSGFEGLQINPIESIITNPRFDEWYLERPTAVASVVTTPVKSGRNAAMLQAANQTTEMQKDGKPGSPFYWSAIFSVLNPGVVADAKNSLVTVKTYFLLPPESMTLETVFMPDFEIMSMDKYEGGIYGTDYMAETWIDPLGAVGSHTSTPDYWIWSVFWTTPWVSAFRLQPNVWYKAEMKVDFKNKNYVSLSLEGPGIHQTFYPPKGQEAIVRKPHGFSGEGMGVFLGIYNGVENDKKVYVDDVEVYLQRI